MPDLDDQIEDMDPSTMSVDDAQQSGAETQQSEGAPTSSSPVTGEADTDDSLLSVVRDVVAQRAEPKDALPEDQTASQAETEDGSDAPTNDDGDDDYADVPFAKHPRFRKVLSERRDFKARAEAHEQDAGRYRNVQNFMDAQGLKAEEAADLLIIGGLMKTNPAEALKRARPILQQLVIAAGEHPEAYPDLAERIQRGEINRQTAIEISRARGMQQSVQATRSFEDQRRQQQEQSNAHMAVIEAGNAWENERRAKDPNFEAKLEPFKREMAYIQMQEGKPTAGDKLVDQFNRAYKAVNANFRPAPTRAAPQQKRAITPVPSGQVAGNAAPSELSTLDIVRQHTRKASA